MHSETATGGLGFQGSALFDARYTSRPSRMRDGCVMEADGWPTDPLSVAALVVRAIEDITASSEEERDVLLADLRCAAWGCVWAQNQ
jgi:hypothetical protein